MILDAAVLFFAERGFEAQLGELTERLGVSQGLIFRYFGNKRTLIERVYEQVYVARWLPAWERMLRDRTHPLEMRLVNFYRSYLDAVDDYVWIRTALYSGLAGNDLTRRYIITRVEKLLKIIMAEIASGEANADDLTECDRLHELAWHLHSTFIYYLIRKYVYRVPVTSDRDAFIETVVHNFVAAFPGLSATDKVESLLDGTRERYTGRPGH